MDNVKWIEFKWESGGALKNTPSVELFLLKRVVWDFPGGAVVKNLPANAGDMGSIPSPGRSYMPQNN